MEVIVTKKHCSYYPERVSLLQTNYTDRKDCPLYRAIVEQYPKFPVLRVGAYAVFKTDNQGWMDIKGEWAQLGPLFTLQLINNEISEVKVTLEEPESF